LDLGTIFFSSASTRREEKGKRRKRGKPSIGLFGEKKVTPRVTVLLGLRWLNGGRGFIPTGGGKKVFPALGLSKGKEGGRNGSVRVQGRGAKTSLENVP